MTVYENNELPAALSVKKVSELLGVCQKVGYSIVKNEGLGIRVGERRIIVPRNRFLNYLDKTTDF